MWVVVGGGGGGMRANTETGRSSARAGAFYDHVNIRGSGENIVPVQG